MKTLIISSSLNPNSHSAKVCHEIEKKLKEQNIDVQLIDLRGKELNLFWQEKTADMEAITKAVEEADNYIFGMAVYNYSINDSLKALIDNCFPGKEHKLFGIVSAAGGDRSYLATQHLVQICMNEWRMIPLPRTVYVTGKDVNENNEFAGNICERIDQFVSEFIQIGKKLS